MELPDNPTPNASDAGAVMESAPEAILPRNASYQFEYAEEGVFLLVTYEEAGGTPLRFEIVVQELNRRNITAAIVDLRMRTKRYETRIRVADPGTEPDLDSEPFVYIARDEMSAEMVLMPPCGAGRAKTAEELLETLRDKWGVVYGLDEEAVTYAAASRAYDERVPIAAGLAPVAGEDGRVVLLFNTQYSYAPKLAEDGSADYKDLSIFAPVREGAVLATVVPAGQGTEGFTVKGASLTPKKGTEARLPKGKNVRVSDDGMSLIAAKSGRVDYINGRVEISDVFLVPMNVDMSTGNIRFDGDVIVPGNVISGLTIEATGLIEVRGYVEDATLIAGKDIVLKNGMQGVDKGRLCADGNIVARFLERCEIEAKGNIFSDYIVQCRAIACGSITVKGKWGKILGGEVRAGKGIFANYVGAPSHESTVVELGSSPDLRARCIRLETSKNQMKVQLDKINSLTRVIPSRSDTSERQEIRQKLIDAKEQLQQQYDEAAAEIEQLTQKLAEHSGARLHVFKTIYPNVKVIIDSCSMTTRSQIEYSTFLYRDGEVVFTACEAKM